MPCTGEAAAPPRARRAAPPSGRSAPRRGGKQRGNDGAIFFSRRRPGAGAHSPGSDDQGAAGAGQRGPQNFDRLPVDFGVLFEFRKVVDKGGVNHAVRQGRSAAQAFEVFQMAAMHLAPAAIRAFAAASVRARPST